MKTKIKRRKIPKNIAIIWVLIANSISFLIGFALYYISANSTQVSTPVPKELIGIILGIVITLFVSDKYLKPLLEDCIDLEVSQRNTSYQEEIENKLPLDALERQNLDLLYALQKVYSSVKQLNLQNLSLGKDHSISGLEIDEKVKKYGESEAIYDKALEELLESDRKEDLIAVVRNTVTKGLNISPEDDKYSDYSIPIYAYLRSWLVCSIKCRKYMPVEPILDSNTNAKTHIKAIKYIRNTILDGKNKNLLFPSQDTINIIKQYLDKLIEMIQTTI
jgi:hypothetical protein